MSFGATLYCDPPVLSMLLRYQSAKHGDRARLRRETRGPRHYRPRDIPGSCIRSIDVVRYAPNPPDSLRSGSGAFGAVGWTRAWGQRCATSSICAHDKRVEPSRRWRCSTVKTPNPRAPLRIAPAGYWLKLGSDICETQTTGRTSADLRMVADWRQTMFAPAWREHGCPPGSDHSKIRSTWVVIKRAGWRHVPPETPERQPVRTGPFLCDRVRPGTTAKNGLLPRRRRTAAAWKCPLAIRSVSNP